MELGFDTIGSATVICYDRVPVLITDPWVRGTAFFGSWTLTHEIPDEQMEAIAAAKYVWFSHGHPDHLNPESLLLFRDKKILVPDHVGKRIYNDLRADGYDVQILTDRVWYQLSENVRVLCIPDYNQDAILLMDVGGRLLINLNDASDNGRAGFIRKLVRQYDISFVLALENTGDLDMFNLHEEDGSPIRQRQTEALKNPLGRRAGLRLANFGATYFIPFSSMHCYQREDSVWANAYNAGLADYHNGPAHLTRNILPAFIRYDCKTDEFVEINPKTKELVVQPAALFGDDWSETLEKETVSEIEKYFHSIEHLSTFLDYINIRVGGKDNVISFKTRKFNRGLTFEAPRESLTTAVRYKVFDDLLIGNFMRIYFHGNWKKKTLYPDFSPYVAKYGDNGGAHSEVQLKAYFKEYRERSAGEYLRWELQLLHSHFESKAIDTLRTFVPDDSKAYRFTKKIYRTLIKPGTS